MNILSGMILIATFISHNNKDLEDRDNGGVFKILKKLTLSESGIKLIDSMLRYDINKRYNINQVINSEFFTQK